MTTPRRSVIIGVRQAVNVFYLKFQNFLSRVESQACLLEYTFPRAFPSHTSYPASDRTNAVKRNKPLTSKVCFNLLPDYSAVPFLELCSSFDRKTQTLNKLKSVLMFQIIIIFLFRVF